MIRIRIEELDHSLDKLQDELDKLDELVNPTVEGSGSGNAIYDPEFIAKLSFNFNYNLVES